MEIFCVTIANTTGEKRAQDRKGRMRKSVRIINQGDENEIR